MCMNVRKFIIFVDLKKADDKIENVNCNVLLEYADQWLETEHGKNSAQWK